MASPHPSYTSCSLARSVSVSHGILPASRPRRPNVGFCASVSFYSILFPKGSKGWKRGGKRTRDEKKKKKRSRRVGFVVDEICGGRERLRPQRVTGGWWFVISDYI